MTRRTVRLERVLVVVLAVLAPWLALGGARTRGGDAAETTFIVVRHGERADATADAELSAEGIARAQRLAAALRDAGIDTVYTSDTKRTTRMAQDTVDALGIKAERQVKYSSTVKPSELAQTLLKEPAGRVVLVVGHSHINPMLVRAMGGWEVAPMKDAEFDDVFVITASGGKAVRLIRAGYPPLRAAAR